MSNSKLEGFHQAAQSLKLYRRAELQDEDSIKSLIGDLYVDPLPNDHVLKTMLKASTTFIVGRKGTGKSTVFQRAQFELAKSNDVATAYVDIKTVYESSQVERNLGAPLRKNGDAEPLSPEQISKLLLYRSFLRAVIREIRHGLDKKTVTMWDRFQEFFSGSRRELFEQLDELLDDIEKDDFYSIVGAFGIQRTEQAKAAKEAEFGGELGVDSGAIPTVRTSVSGRTRMGEETTDSVQYSDVLMRSINIKEFLLRLKNVLERIRVRHLYVFVDDFSELPEDAMHVVVDTLLAPLNNWSEELIKFKVAAYPGRIYYGQIDKTKIDEINLDLYRLYGSSDVSTMEDKAIDFTKRLIQRRIQHYCQCGAEEFLPTSDEAWRLLFHTTMGNPRNLGYVLYYLHEAQLIYGDDVGLRAIREAARRYYEEKIEPYFHMSRFLHESFDERSSVFSLKELLETFLKQAQALKRHRGSAVTREIEGSPPTSHFHIASQLESLLSTLELNFFLTKYFEQKDRDGRLVSVFALNFGLCEKYSVVFGRPRAKGSAEARKFRLYFVERIFDYTPILNEYIRKNQEIVCAQCGAKHEIDKLPALQTYDMLCPVCKEGRCEVRNLSRKYESVIREVDPQLLLPQTELGIIQTLHVERRPLYAKDIASELDCSYQLVGKRAKFLDERGLVDRDANEQGRRQYSVTDRARELYFTAMESSDLDVESNHMPEDATEHESGEAAS